MSLTPESRAAEATTDATYEGMLNGVLTLVPSMAGVGYLLKNYPVFAARTNWQSRTAIAIMPAVFVAALSSELKLSNRMREIAQETKHTLDTATWAQEQWEEQKHSSGLSEGQHVTALYQESLRNTNVCVVPELQFYHNAANFVAKNPLGTLAAAAVPAYIWIFHGRNEQQHLQLATKIMHTRVIGQAAAMGILLVVMGFKDFMDSNGRFISQEQADMRVREMERVREDLLQRLDDDQQRQAEARQVIQEAHKKDLKTKKKQREQEQQLSAASVAERLTTDAPQGVADEFAASTKHNL